MTVPRFSLVRRCFIVAAVLLAGHGCGPSGPRIYPVAGRVIFSDGSPVRTGMVELESSEHSTTASGRIQPDGSFVLGTFTETDGAASGSHRAIVVQMVINEGLVKHAVDHGAPVDPMYGVYESSPLTVQIEPTQENRIELVVEKKARR